MKSPPPLPDRTKKSAGMNTPTKILVGIGVAFGLVIVLLIACRAAGLLIPYRVPTGSMSPAIRPGDCLIMEGFSIRNHAPQRGEIIVFTTDGIKSFKTSSVFVMRAIGLPNEFISLREGEVYINNTPAIIKNSSGKLRYPTPEIDSHYSVITEKSIPPDQYFMIGDNALNSFDSRYWGTLPSQNIRGRVWLRYWPPDRIGRVE